MRIALDCRSVYAGMGGIGRITAATARELPHARPADTIVLIHGNRRPDRPIVSAPNVENVCVPAPLCDALFEQVHLPGLLDDLAIDLYHNTAFAAPIATGSTRTVATVHDTVFRRRPELVVPAFRDYLDEATKVSCAVASSVVTASKFARREIRALYGREQVEIVPHGIDPVFFDLPRLRARDPFVLYVGSFEEKKNVVPLLRAFAALRRIAPALPHRLVLVGGTGSTPLDLDAIFDREPELAERVSILGYQFEESLHRFYGAADAFCYLSEYEGFGLPPLEAMAAGVPTIVSDRSSLPEVTAGGAVIVDPAATERVAEQLALLLESPEIAARWRQQGRHVARRYTWRAAIDRLSALYDRVLSDAPSEEVVTA